MKYFKCIVVIALVCYSGYVKSEIGLAQEIATELCGEEARYTSGICRMFKGNDSGVYFVRLSAGLVPFPRELVLHTKEEGSYRFIPFDSMTDESEYDLAYIRIRSSIPSDRNLQDLAISGRTESLRSLLKGVCGLSFDVSSYSGLADGTELELKIRIITLDDQVLLVSEDYFPLVQVILSSFVHHDCGMSYSE